MKKRISILLIGLIAIAIGLVGCKQKDTGIVVNIGDTNNDSSQNAQVVGDSNLTINNNNSGSDGANSEQVQQVVQVNSLENLLGTWVTNYGTIYNFIDTTNFTGYMAETGEDIYGTYETDNKTFLNICITREIEVENTEDVNNVDILDTENAGSIESNIILPVYETVEENHNYNIKSIKEGNDGNSEIILAENDIEIIITKYISVTNDIDTNNDSYYDVSKELEPVELTQEQLDEMNRSLLELGIDPVTGLPLPDTSIEQEIIIE